MFGCLSLVLELHYWHNMMIGYTLFAHVSTLFMPILVIYFMTLMLLGFSLQ